MTTRARSTITPTAILSNSSRNTTRHANENEDVENSQQYATEVSQLLQTIPTQPANPPFTDLLASIGNVEAMLASWESESRDTDEMIRDLYVRSLLSAPTSSTRGAASSAAARQISDTATTRMSAMPSVNKSNENSPSKKKASDETIASDLAFHNSQRARNQRNLFERVPTEILCAILGWVVEPIGKKMAATDDGDGPTIGNPLLYWHIHPDRTLLRLVCRTWNQTIIAMAREIHIKLGSDESMARLLENEESRRARPATSSRMRPLQGRIGGDRHPYLSMAIRNAYSRSQIPRPHQAQQQRQPLRRSARLSHTSPNNTPGATRTSPSLPTLTRTAFRDQSLPVEQEPAFSFIYTRHSRDQYERQRLAKQKAIPIQGFYRYSSPTTFPKAMDTLTMTRSSSTSGLSTQGNNATKRANPWSFPPSISSLSVEGDFGRTSDSKEDITLSACFSGNQPRPGGGLFESKSGHPQYHINDPQFGTMLDHWLRAATPKGLVKFSISNSADFGLNGLLSLPQAITTLKISRCPKINGGVLHLGFQHLSNLTSLTVCSELMFTDETFSIALKSLRHLTHFVYIYPCDAVQPVWRDLFRYCSSCELYHRRITTKTYSRTLLMPELPDQIQDFTFEMDEPRFQELRVETFEQNRHGLDRRDIRYALTLWKANDPVIAQSCTTAWCGFDLAPNKVRSWWPANLTRLDLSKSVITGSMFDVPPQLQELVIAYPLEPKEMTSLNGCESDTTTEDNQWYPDTLLTLEIRGVPYHVPCVIVDDSDSKVNAWMAYVNKMLKMVPQHLQHLITNSFQVPEAESMAAMKERVQNSLITWKVRLLCPQRPRQSGHSMLQLYAPFIYVGDESGEDDEEDEMEIEEESTALSSDEESESDSSLDFMESILGRREFGINRQRRRRQQAQRQARPTLGQTRPIRRAGGHPGPIGNLAGMESLLAAEQYDVTPVMLRQVVKGMKVLESLEVYVNYQHYRLCRANWKGNLSLSEPIPTILSPTYANNHHNGGMIEEMDGDHGPENNDRPQKKLKVSVKRSNASLMTGSASSIAIEGSSRTDQMEMRRNLENLKGKGKKIDVSLQPLGESLNSFKHNPASNDPQAIGKGKGVKRGHEDDNEDTSLYTEAESLTAAIPGTGMSARTGNQPMTSLRYWNNSCCGERCLGWGSIHQD
ncbi:hypothetical protein FBU30_004463 [Linnemannia zychae]|nr:hypothetical protein FBU30_004463 [Linnemannia zychae]